MIINDYRKWRKENLEFIDNLKNHNSLIYQRVHNVFNDLDYIADLPDEELNDDAFSRDYYLIFELGYQFISETIGEAKIYLDKYFSSDLNTFLLYEPLINYSLYINDLKETLIEHDYITQTISREFASITNEIEDILLHKRPYLDSYLKEIDLRLASSFKNKKEYLATHDIYDIIAEEFQNIKDKEIARKMLKEEKENEG